MVFQMKASFTFLSLIQAVLLLSQVGCIIATRPNPNEKTFASSWTAVNNSVTFNLTSANQGGSNFSGVVTFADKSTCTCAFSAKLTDGRFNTSSGSFDVLNCTNPVGYSAIFGCPALVQKGTYSQNGGDLIICQTAIASCLSYH